MAYAYITEFDVGDDRSTINFDAGVNRIFEKGAPQGVLHFSAGFDDNGVFRTYEVWASSQDRQRFMKEVFEPMMAEGLADPTRSNPPDREHGYELHYASP